MRHTTRGSKSFARMTALGALACALVVGCAGREDEVEEAPGDLVDERSSDGAYVGVSRPEQAASPEAKVPDGTPGEDLDDPSITAGCTHIVWCNAPDPLTEVVCDSSDAPCSCGARRAECISDANAVCGHWTNITFNPPIFCP